MKKYSRRYGTLSPLKITLIYLFAAILWIILTDFVLENRTADLEMLSRIQTYKGLLYIILTSAGLYLLIKMYANQIESKDDELRGLHSEHQSDRELMDILFERIPVMITIYDPDLEEFEVNREFEKVTGWSDEETKEINLFEACYPDIDLREEVIEFMNNPGIGWREFPLTTKSGETVETSWTNIRLTDDTSVGIGIDMTETKASQAKLRESRELLRNVFESLEESVILVEPESRKILECNQATEKIFGYSREELVGNSTRMLHLDEEHYEEFNEMGAKALQQKGSFHAEFKMKKKSGEPFYSDHTVTLVYDKEGDVDRVVSVVRDVTEKKKNEKELKQRQKRLLRSQRIGKIGDWEYDVKTEEVQWSPMVYEIYNMNPETAPPSFQEIQQMYVGDDSEKHERYFWNLVEKGKPFDLDLKVRSKSGDQQFIRAIGIPEYNKKGEVSKVRGIVQDITDRKVAEIEKKKLSDIVQKSQNEIYVLDIDTLRFEFVNKGALNNIGYSEEEMYQMTPMDIKPEYDKEAFVENIQPLIRGEQEKKIFETIHKRADGSTYDAEVHVQLIETVEKPLLVAIVLDISERKQAREKIISSIFEGEDRERRRIARELHDGIGQYLAAANMNLEVVNKDIGQLSEKRATQFSKGLTLLKKSINEIHDISHNLMPKAIEDYGLRKAVEALVESYGSSSEIAIRFDCNMEENVISEQKQMHIYRIVQEAVSNAIRYAECTKISIQLYREEDMLYVTIEDNGKGTKFYESDDRDGLGLENMRSRTKALSGTIEFDSKQGEGTVISIRIPIGSKKESNSQYA